MNEDRAWVSIGFRLGLGFCTAVTLFAAAGAVAWRFALREPPAELEHTKVIVRDGPTGPTETLWVAGQKPAACIQLVNLPDDSRPFVDAYRACRNGQWMTFGIMPEEER